MIRLSTKRLNLNLARNVASDAAQVKSNPPVEIQPYIKRSSTDILKALSETVGCDKTAPHFAFIDDPITIPSTDRAKKTYFMAKELGKRAARQLAEEWPTLFQFDRDQPRLPAFRPQKQIDPLQAELTEQVLLNIIESRAVKDASLFYERLRAENVEISEKTRLELFRLMAYYNSSNIPFAEWNEWHGMRNFGDNANEEWKSDGDANLLFESMPKTDEVVSIMIAGLCKYPSKQSIQQANQLYEEHSKNGKIYREAYDLLISVNPMDKCKKLLESMVKNGVKPSVNTFNSLIISTKADKFNNRIKNISQIVGEMKSANLQPNLSTFHLILKSLIDKSFLNDITQKNKELDEKQKKRLALAMSWMNEMLDELESRSELVLNHSNDNLFFAEAMLVAYLCANLKAANRIVDLYESKKNQVKMPSFTTEATFYNRYLHLFIDQTASIDQIYSKYIELVPRLVGVTDSLSSSIYQKLEQQPHWGLLKRAIEDGVAAGQMTRMNGDLMCRHLIGVQYHTLSVSQREEFTQLVNRLVATWIEFSQFTEEYNKRMQRKLSPSQISDLALLLTRIGDYQKAYEMLELVLDYDASHGEEATVVARGYCRPHNMAELFEDALRRKDVYGASLCLEIMSLNMNRSRLEQMSNRMFERCSLTEEQKKLVQGFVRLRPQ